MTEPGVCAWRGQSMMERALAPIEIVQAHYRTRLLRAWKRRHWIEYCFRMLKHLLATGFRQVHHEDAYYGHLVLRLMGCVVLFYTSRVICKGRMTMEEIIFSLKHYWRFVDSEALELQALSREVDENAA
jgi:hypothetical protein